MFYVKKSTNKLKESFNEINIKNDELFSKYLKLQNSNKIQTNNTHNSLCRFLVDQLLQKIIMKYYDKLETVDLELNIFSDLITNSNCDIISDKNIFKLICSISNEFSNILKQLENDPSNEKLKQQVIRLIDSKCKIKFKDEIVFDNEIIKKEDLKIILDILFFIKNFENITTNPYLNLNESLKLINIVRNIYFRTFSESPQE